MAIPAIREEAAVKTYIKTNGNKTATYQAAHPNADYETANSHGSSFVVKCGIENKAARLLSKNKKLSEENIFNSFVDDMNATKPIATDKPIIYVRDNATILETKKTLLKLYGHLRNSDGDSKGATTVNLSIDKLTVNNLNTAIARLDKIATSTDAQTGEIIDADGLED